MTGYVRKDTTNNIADGNVINAADLDSEFDGIQDGFNASTGHTHGGTTGEGAPITKIGPTQDVTASATLLAPKTTNTVDVGSSALKFKDLFLAGNGSIGGTLAVTGVATLGAGAILNTPASVTLTNATGLPIGTGVSGLGTGVATALAVNVGTAGAPVVNGGVLGTPSSGTVTNLTGTASININGTVGATTATTGAFTTLAASSTVTLSGGTANGVTYLNGSKVLTSGSALTFDGTNLGVGVTPSAWATFTGLQVGALGGVNIGGASGDTFYAMNAYYNAGWKYAATGTTALMYRLHNGEHKWSNAPSGTAGNAITFTQAMTLDASGNLGIGTSSPAYKLDISAPNDSTARIKLTTTTGYNIFWSSNTGGGTFFGTEGSTGGVLSSGSAAYSSVMTSLNGNNPISFGINSTEKMRLDGSGNLGLGVTPSAWASGVKGLQVGANSYASAVDLNNGVTAWGSNYYNDGGNKFANASSRYALQILQDTTNGAQSWRVSNAAGTAGNAITFTTGMTLDAAGGLKTLNTIGVGNTAPSTSGAGITFPATQSASSNANTLDDYEEGTWTPNQGSGVTVSGTFSSTAVYTKIGRLVYVSGYLTSTSESISCTGGGGILTTNLPFTTGFFAMGTAVNGSQSAISATFLSGTTIYLTTAMSTTTNIYFTATYQV